MKKHLKRMAIGLLALGVVPGSIIALIWILKMIGAEDVFPWVGIAFCLAGFGWLIGLVIELIKEDRYL